MSETTTNTENIEENTKENSNHIAGCGIFSIILAMVVFLASVTIYSYFNHKEAFVAFSQETSVPTEIATTTDSSTTAIDQKFSTFAELVKNQKHATMQLTVDEINTAIAHFDKLSELKNTLFVTQITDTHVLARASFPINAGFDGTRHFNGLLKFQPVIAQGSLFPIVEEAISDTDAQVPPKVLQAIPVLMFVNYRNDETIKDVFHKLTKVELKDNILHISSDPGSTATAIIDMDVTEETNVGFQLFALLTFIFITTIAFVLWYSKFKKKQKQTLP
ncbi:MAG: hypothetical protein ACSHX6_08965 [Akkermansiaceae bacterium]